MSDLTKFVISTDTCADLPEEFYKENNIDVHPLYYSFGEEMYGGDKQLTPKQFFDRMRGGEMPTTQATNPENSKELFLAHAKKGENIIHIAFSSGLSSTYQNACIAAGEVMEEYPEIKISVIDSLAASLGQGLIVYKAVQLKNEGKSYEEIRDYVENNKLHYSHHFTVDDLFHLFRGGRVSRTTAIIGTLAGIKPLLHVDNEGHLINIGKVRGRKKSLQNLAEKFINENSEYINEVDVIGITHGDCLEDAQYLADYIKEKTGRDKFIINMLCPTIGSHTGPGLIALFFTAEKR